MGLKSWIKILLKYSKMVKTINDKIFGVSLANKNIEVQTFSCLKIKKN